MSKLLKGIGLIGATASISYLTYRQIANSMFEKVFKRNEVNTELNQELKDWFIKSNVSSVDIQSFDGLKLNAYYVENNPTNNIVLLSHGWNSRKEDMFFDAKNFDELGYNLLLIDHRASGKSEGVYHTFGQKESLDILLWCEYLIHQNPKCNIVLYGVSMGAASVMMTAAYKLKNNIKCIIEDCGYSSFKEELHNVIKKDYQLENTFVILRMIENQMIRKLNIEFSDIEPKNCLKDNEIPLLIIHGKEDRFVPFEMSKIIYANNKGVKKYYPVTNAKHAESHLNPNYFNHVKNFIDEFIDE